MVALCTDFRFLTSWRYSNRAQRGRQILFFFDYWLIDCNIDRWVSEMHVIAFDVANYIISLYQSVLQL
jgi:hypothetical protein